MVIFEDFKNFISRGNVIDMAVGIIIGASFTKIVDTLVNNILMPPIGALLGGVDFSAFKIVLKRGTETSAPVTIDYGLFINTLINFFIVATSVFILIKVLGALYRTKESGQKIMQCPDCKVEIPRDAKRCGHCTSIIS